jgi:glycerophosphoryl diester phosphodiesterase
MKVFIKVSGVLIFLFFCSFLQNKAISQDFEMPQRGFCAHRGAMTTHPENTLPAFNQAILSGAQMIELDVQFSKDSALIIMHDGTVDRTTNGHGEVASLTLKELKLLDAGSWMDSSFTGTSIPVLKEVFEIMPKNTWLNVHLKGGYVLGKKVAALILEMGMAHQAVMAVQAEAGRGARSVSKDILICNMERQSGGLDYVEGTIQKDADFIQLKGPVTDGFKNFADLLHEKGIKVNYFGTDDPEILGTLFGLGIDFPLVNDIVKTVDYSNEFQITPVSPLF